MSVTCILVPLLEPEAEALFEGGASAAQARETIARRAGQLRARVARVDEIREELHELLFSRWEGSRYRAPSRLALVWRYFQPKKPAKAVSDWDPFVHLWGRSLPVGGKTSHLTAQRLTQLLELDDAAFESALAEDLHAFDPRAAERYLSEKAKPPPAGLDAAIGDQAAVAGRAVERPPESLREAVDAVARLSAWSWPVWRLDGEMLTPLLRTVGATVEATQASPLFEVLKDEHPDLEKHLTRLPRALGDFAGAGAFLSSLDVKSLARSLRLYHSRVAMNVAESGENELIAMAHVRLLEEALLFCESQGLALIEAAGVEWHDWTTAPTRRPHSLDVSNDR